MPSLSPIPFHHQRPYCFHLPLLAHRHSQRCSHPPPRRRPSLLPQRLSQSRRRSRPLTSHLYLFSQFIPSKFSLLSLTARCISRRFLVLSLWFGGSFEPEWPQPPIYLCLRPSAK